MTRPLAIDLFCGLGGWTEGLLAEGYDVVGFDNEEHVYGEHRYPAQLVIQDVLTLHGSQFRNAALIVASPPCQEFSYMAMPWKRAKQIARALRGQDDFPINYKGSRTTAELTALFDACFRIQREASENIGRHIPLIVENVNGAQPWVGPAQWHYGSFYLWGDVPALMPTRNDPRDNRREATRLWRGMVRRRHLQNCLAILGSQSRLGTHRQNPFRARASHRPRLPPARGRRRMNARRTAELKTEYTMTKRDWMALHLVWLLFKAVCDEGEGALWKFVDAIAERRRKSDHLRAKEL